jgi:hypothetical protein
MATKTNNKKMYVTGGIILGVAGLAYVFRKEIKNLFVKTAIDGGDINSIDPNNLLPPVDPGTIVVNNDVVAPVVVEDPTKAYNIDTALKKGQAKNDMAKLLQYNIREIQSMLGIPLLETPDGVFGNKTEKALKVISDFYKKNNYWTVRKARETVVRYAGQKGKAFPLYLQTASNYKDLRKIYDATKIKNIDLYDETAKYV